MTPQEELVKETLEMLRKAQTTGVLATTGMFGVDLSGRVSLVPVNTPARNNSGAFPRIVAGQGDPYARWRAWLNVNSAQSSAAVGKDFAGSQTIFSEQDMFAPYVPLAKFGRVTLDAIALGRNYDDVQADGELQTLIQLFIAQDMNIINGQAWALPTMGSLTLGTATTGGSITSGATVHVRVAARSGANYFDGGSGVATGDASQTVGGTNTNVVTASWAAVKGAVAYDVYVGTSAANCYYYGTVTIGSITITAVPGGAPTSVAAALYNAATYSNGVPPLMSTLLPGQGVSPLTNPATPGNGVVITSGDTSYNANYYNGVIASTLGDFGALGPVTPGSGTASGAVFIDNGGAPLTLSGGGISLLDQMNDQLWTSVQLSPTAYMMNSLQGDEISKAIAGSNSATTFLPPTDADARTNLAAGGFVGRYINRAAGGVPVAIEIHPRVPPGTIIARTDRVPFPASRIGSAFEVRCQMDTTRFDYAANYNPGVSGGGPRFDFEIRSMETLVNYAPTAQAIAENVG